MSVAAGQNDLGTDAGWNSKQKFKNAVYIIRSLTLASCFIFIGQIVLE
jgi:hypothetical protein